MKLTRDWGLSFQGHLIPQSFQAFHQAVTHAAGIEPVQVIRTQFLVLLSPAQHVVHDDQERVCQRRDRPLPAPPRCYPLEVTGQVGVLRSARRPRRLDQRGAEPVASLPHRSGPPLARALVILTARLVTLREMDKDRRRFGASLIQVPGMERPVLVLMEIHFTDEGKPLRSGCYRVDEAGALVISSERFDGKVTQRALEDALPGFKSRVKYWRGWVDETNQRQKDELEKLEGVWQIRSGEQDGKVVNGIDGDKLTIHGESLTQHHEGKEVMKATVHLYPDGKPKATQLRISDGTDKGMTKQAIYELEGEELRICLGKVGEVTLPTDFTTKAGSGRVVWSLGMDALADGGLGQAEGLCGFGKAAELGGFRESFEMRK